MNSVFTSDLRPAARSPMPRLSAPLCPATKQRPGAEESRRNTRTLLPALAMASALLAAGAQAQGYEPWLTSRDASFLPAELRKSPVHEVKGRVVVEGYQHAYRVESP